MAAVALLGLSFVDNAQLQNISAVSKIDDPAALEVIYDTQSSKELMTPDGEKFILADEFTKEEFVTITSQIADPENAEKKITNSD